MKNKKILLLVYLVLLIIITIISLLFSSKINKILFSIIVLAFCLLGNYCFKRKRFKNLNDKQATIIITIFSILYLTVYYMLGMFFEFYKNPFPLASFTFINVIIPFTIIIVCSEYLRNWILQYKSKLLNVVSFILFVLLDVYLYNTSFNYNNLNDMLTLFGFVIFTSSIYCYFYNYYSINYGAKGIIIFRLIIVLYSYVIPIIPDVYMYFKIFLRVIYAFFMLIFIKSLFNTDIKIESNTTRNKNILVTTLVLAFCAILVMLVSRQFKYAIMVVGSQSMVGTFDKGDVVFYERYDDKPLEVGDIILFQYSDTQIIHRIKKIKSSNGNYCYYTKGDANITDDSDYRVKEDIRGKYLFHIKYIGYPTLWVSYLFN